MAENSGMGDIGSMLMSMATRPGTGYNEGGLGGGGILGGLILGSLLNRNGGGLFGGNGVDGGAVLRNPPEQTQANMSLMQGIGAVDKAVAVSTAAMEASQAAQSLGIQSQLSQVAAATVAQINGVKDAVNSNAMVIAQQLSGVDRSIMENRYELAKDITADGDRTRSLITAQYEATLNRQLAEANAAIIELRSEDRSNRRARENEITVTQTVNQAQQQQQQQNNFSHLYAMLGDAVQNIRATNQAINIGAGTQTATPTNTSTNSRVN